MSDTATTPNPASSEEPTGLPSVPEDREPRLPSRLSPSRAADFKQCPKLFYYKSVLGMQEPGAVHLVQGSVAHRALELMFENHPREERTVDVALGYIGQSWEEVAEERNNREVCPEGSDEEQQMLDFVDQVIRNYFNIEDPTKFDPDSNEQKITVELGDGLRVLGIIDRLDTYEYESNEFVYISDYKTGRPMKPKDRFAREKFFAMRVYALLVYESQGIIPHQLRLLYLQGRSPSEAIRTMDVTEGQIRKTRSELLGMWKQMKRNFANDNWPTKTGPLCNWCHFQPICPAWADEVDGIVDDVDGTDAA